MKRICPRCNEAFMFRIRKIYWPDCPMPVLRIMHKSKSTCPMAMFVEPNGEIPASPYFITFPSGQLDWAIEPTELCFWTPKYGLTITIPKRFPYTITEEELRKYLVLV